MSLLIKFILLSFVQVVVRLYVRISKVQLSIYLFYLDRVCCCKNCMILLAEIQKTHLYKKVDFYLEVNYYLSQVVSCFVDVDKSFFYHSF